MKEVYLLTGRPATGKTSLIKQVASHMKGKAGGFYTEEIRSRGVREGFKLIMLDGGETTLAHVDIRSPYRVSKYGVDVDVLDRVGVPALRKAVLQRNLVIIDEIGKMELFSDYFRETVLWVINSGKKVLGTIMLNPYPWTDSVKRQPQVNLINITRDNSRQVQEELFRWLGITEFLKL